jgi:hypothetical protein
MSAGKTSLALLLLFPLAAQSGPAPAAPAAVIPPGRGSLLVDLDGTELELFTYQPAGWGGHRMLLVLHGVLRNADRYRDDAVVLGDRWQALIVAPRFDAERFPSRRYQRGGLLDASGAPAPPADWTYALVPKIAAKVRELTGRPALPFSVLGHSAGGQFVARMAAFQETGAIRLVAANPGSHLFPVLDLPFGYGFGGLPPELAGDERLRRYLAAPLTIYLGSADDGPDEYFDGSPDALEQGGGRHQRGLACYWTARTLARERGWPFGWRLVEARGIGHDHAKMFAAAECELALFSDPAQREADLRHLAAKVREEWSYFEHRAAAGLDLDALLARALEGARVVRDDAGWAVVLRRFVAALDDGHAAVRAPGATPIARRLPFRVRDCAEGLVVIALAPGHDGAPAVGDLWLEQDGVPIAERIAAQQREVFASTPGMRRRLAIERLQWIAAERTRCRFSTSAGDVERDLDTLGAEPAELAAQAGGDPVELTWPRERVACLRIRSFAVPRWREWLQARVEERDAFLAEGRDAITGALRDVVQRGATTLLLDLRGNAGGTDLLGIHLAEHLLPGAFRYFLLSAKVDGRWTEPGGFEHGRTPPPVRFAGRVIALIDERCFSATDDLLRCLDDLHPDFHAVGRPTGGGTGAPRAIATLPNTGAEIVLCTQRVHGPRGGLIEGVGTVPDVLVRWTRDDCVQQRDPDLAAALQLAK